MVDYVVGDFPAPHAAVERVVGPPRTVCVVLDAVSMLVCRTEHKVFIVIVDAVVVCVVVFAIVHFYIFVFIIFVVVTVVVVVVVAVVVVVVVLKYVRGKLHLNTNDSIVDAAPQITPTAKPHHQCHDGQHWQQVGILCHHFTSFLFMFSFYVLKHELHFC